MIACDAMRAAGMYDVGKIRNVQGEVDGIYVAMSRGARANRSA